MNDFDGFKFDETMATGTAQPSPATHTDNYELLKAKLEQKGKAGIFKLCRTFGQFTQTEQMYRDAKLRSYIRPDDTLNGGLTRLETAVAAIRKGDPRISVETATAMANRDINASIKWSQSQVDMLADKLCAMTYHIYNYRHTHADNAETLYRGLEALNHGDLSNCDATFAAAADAITLLNTIKSNEPFELDCFKETPTPHTADDMAFIERNPIFANKTHEELDVIRNTFRWR